MKLVAPFLLKIECIIIDGLIRSLKQRFSFMASFEYRCLENYQSLSYSRFI